MNTNLIAKELNRRQIYDFVFYFDKRGKAIQFVIPVNPPRYWNALLPIDDESDMKFVEFVESHYRKYYPIKREAQQQEQNK